MVLVASLPNINTFKHDYTLCLTEFPLKRFKDTVDGCVCITSTKQKDIIKREEIRYHHLPDDLHSVY